MLTQLKQEFLDVPLFLLIVIVLIVVTQGTLLFIDARKHNKYPWFWGLWGMISFPLPSILYLIFVRKMYKKIRLKKRDD